MGKKIVAGIYISVATDSDYDTAPLEGWLKGEIQAYIANELREMIKVPECNCKHARVIVKDMRQRALSRGYDINPKSESEG